MFTSVSSSDSDSVTESSPRAADIGIARAFGEPESRGIVLTATSSSSVSDSVTESSAKGLGEHDSIGKMDS